MYYHNKLFFFNVDQDSVRGWLVAEQCCVGLILMQAGFFLAKC
jgi:hypothetical protein